jgi:hypothetical protein
MRAGCSAETLPLAAVRPDFSGVCRASTEASSWMLGVLHPESEKTTR